MSIGGVQNTLQIVGVGFKPSIAGVLTTLQLLGERMKGYDNKCKTSASACSSDRSERGAGKHTQTDRQNTKTWVHLRC